METQAHRAAWRDPCGPLHSVFRVGAPAPALFLRLRWLQGSAGLGSDGGLMNSTEPMRADLGSTPLRELRRRGFTLIEMVIVVTIVGIIAAIVVGATRPHQESAERSAARSQLTTVRAQIEVLRARRGAELPPEQGANGTDALWPALTNPNGDSPALLRGVPQLPRGYEWSWDGAWLRLSYTGAVEGLAEEVGSW